MGTESAEKSRPLARSNSLTAIELKNFRCYKNLIRFPVKPLTIFTGQNSVGKSTLFKALSLVGDTEGELKMNFSGANSVSHGIPDFTSVKNFSAKTDEVHFGFEFKDAQFNIEFSPDSEEFGSCRVRRLEMIHLPSKKAVVRARFHWDVIDGLEVQGHFPIEFNRVDHPEEFHKFFDVLSHSQDISRLSMLEDSGEDNPASVGNFRRRAWEELPSLKNTLKGSKRFKFNRENSSTTLGAMIRELKWELRKQFHESAHIRDRMIREFKEEQQQLNPTQARHERTAKFLELKEKMDLEIFSSKPITKEIKGLEAMNALIGVASAQVTNIMHLSSKRLVAPRLFQKGDDLYDELSSRSNQLLFSDGKVRRSASRAIRFFNRWMKEMNVGDEVRVENVEGMAVKVKIREGQHWMNLADRGMGYAQVFRLLFTISTALLQASPRSPTILCIEEPDSNLHPSVQSQLVEPIVDAMSINPNLTIYLETHSEYMVRKLMVLAKEKPELSQDWAVNYLEKERGIFKVRHVTFGEDGRLSERLGTGFLDEASKLTRELL